MILVWVPSDSGYSVILWNATALTPSALINCIHPYSVYLENSIWDHCICFMSTWNRSFFRTLLRGNQHRLAEVAQSSTHDSGPQVTASVRKQLPRSGTIPLPIFMYFPHTACRQYAKGSKNMLHVQDCWVLLNLQYWDCCSHIFTWRLSKSIFSLLWYTPFTKAFREANELNHFNNLSWFTYLQGNAWSSLWQSFTPSA